MVSKRELRQASVQGSFSDSHAHLQNHSSAFKRRRFQRSRRGRGGPLCCPLLTGPVFCPGPRNSTSVKYASPPVNLSRIPGLVVGWEMPILRAGLREVFDRVFRSIATGVRRGESDFHNASYSRRSLTTISGLSTATPWCCIGSRSGG